MIAQPCMFLRVTRSVLFFLKKKRTSVVLDSAHTHTAKCGFGPEGGTHHGLGPGSTWDGPSPLTLFAGLEWLAGADLCDGGVL